MNDRLLPHSFLSCDIIKFPIRYVKYFCSLFIKNVYIQGFILKKNDCEMICLKKMRFDLLIFEKNKKKCKRN